MLDMIAEYMEGGFLENIVDMFKADPALFELLPALISDGRGRVRLGTVALVEESLPIERARIEREIDNIAGGLAHENPIVRGDVIYLLEIIGGEVATGLLRRALTAESNPAVRELIIDALGDNV